MENNNTSKTNNIINSTNTTAAANVIYLVTGAAGFLGSNVCR